MSGGHILSAHSSACGRLHVGSNEHRLRLVRNLVHLFQDGVFRRQHSVDEVERVFRGGWRRQEIHGILKADRGGDRRTCGKTIRLSRAGTRNYEQDKGDNFYSRARCLAGTHFNLLISLRRAIGGNQVLRFLLWGQSWSNYEGVRIGQWQDPREIPHYPWKTDTFGMTPAS
jgi:hypothetical protein